MQDFISLGWVSLIPVLIVIMVALTSKRATESLLLGTLIAAMILAYYQGPGGLASISYW